MRYSARLQGKALVLSGDGKLPLVCLKCGTHDGVVRRVTKLRWTPMWARALMFCVVGLIAMALTRREAELAIPLCAPCYARWSTARRLSIAVVVAMAIGFVAVRVLAEPRVALACLAVFVAGFAALTIAYIRPRSLRAQRITDTELHLLGVHPRAAQEITDPVLGSFAGKRNQGPVAGPEPRTGRGPAKRNQGPVRW